MKSYTVYIEKDEDGLFVGSVPNLPGCHTQGATLDELMVNLKEVIALCVRNAGEVDGSEFVGVQKIEVSV